MELSSRVRQLLYPERTPCHIVPPATPATSPPQCWPSCLLQTLTLPCHLYPPWLLYFLPRHLDSVHLSLVEGFNLFSFRGFPV